MAWMGVRLFSADWGWLVVVQVYITHQDLHHIFAADDAVGLRDVGNPAIEPLVGGVLGFNQVVFDIKCLAELIELMSSAYLSLF